MATIDADSAVINAVRFAQQAADPAAPSSGGWKLYFKSGGAYYESSAGVVTAIGPSLTDPTTTKGDLIVHGTGLARLPIGTDGQVLTARAAATNGLDWEANAALTNPMTTQDDIILGGASGAAARLAKGADGQVLTVDPTTHHLLWAAATGGNPMTTIGDMIAGTTAGAQARLGVGAINQVLTVGDGAPFLSPPVAPTVSTAGTGGTISAGTYQVEVTYVNVQGETTASGSTSVTTIGSTSTITCTSPVAAGTDSETAGFWYAYVTQAGGATYTRQQTVGSPTALGTNLTLSAPPSSSGAGAPAVNSAGSRVPSWATSPTGVTTLAADSDVAITTPADGQRLVYQSSSSKWINDAEYVYVSIPLGDGTNVITTGIKQPDAVGVPAGTLVEARLVTSGAVGSLTVDVLRATYAAFPTFTSLVGAGTKPNIASAATSQKYSDTTMTSWTTSLADGDMLRANVTAAATLTAAILILKIRRTS